MSERTSTVYVCRLGHTHSTKAEKDDCESFPQTTTPAAEILRRAAETNEERGAIYGDNISRIPIIRRAFFPDGVPQAVLDSPQYHLFEMIIMKLSRWSITELKHKDSIHDVCVYAAMAEAEIEKKL